MKVMMAVLLRYRSAGLLFYMILVVNTYSYLFYVIQLVRQKEQFSFRGLLTLIFVLPCLSQLILFTTHILSVTLDENLSTAGLYISLAFTYILLKWCTFLLKGSYCIYSPVMYTLAWAGRIQAWTYAALLFIRVCSVGLALHDLEYTC